MAFAAALPKGIELQPEDSAATFVVPAPNGCNLNCPFCVVRMRHETVCAEPTLTAHEYVQFLKAMAVELRLGLVSLQGYEPLLPESWPFSLAILKAGNELGVPTAIVTNGTHLADHVDDLVSLGIKGITVSLDSATPELHDIARRTSGAFAMTLAGLKAAAASPLRPRMIVASVLQPGKVHDLIDLPELLSSLGIELWVVTPLYHIRRRGFGGPADSHEQIVTDLAQLQPLARAHGINMLVDDEFDELTTHGNVTSLGELKLRRMKRLDQVLRLTPNGSFSIGRDILCRVGDDTPTWRPGKEDASSFVSRVFQDDIDAGIEAQIHYA